MTSVSRRFEPDEKRAAVYERKYALYCKTVDCLDGLWTEMQSLIDADARRVGD